MLTRKSVSMAPTQLGWSRYYAGSEALTTENLGGGWTILVRISHHLRTGLDGKMDEGRDFFYFIWGKELRESAGAGQTTFFDPNAHARPIVEGRFFRPASLPGPAGWPGRE